MWNFALYNWDPAARPGQHRLRPASTFTGSGFPFEKMDHAFVTESGPTYASGPQAQGKRIVEFAPGADGDFTGRQPIDLVEYTGVGKATAAGLAAGPDGLYFTDLYKDVGFTSPIDPGANVLRVRWPDPSAPTPEPGPEPGPEVDARRGRPAPRAGRTGRGAARLPGGADGGGLPGGLQRADRAPRQATPSRTCVWRP